MSSNTSKKRQLVTFYVGRLFFGIDVQKVQEVIKHQQMTPVPRAHKIVEGLINLRGQILTAINLRKRLELGEFSAEQLPMNVVIRNNEEVISLLVDKIGDVIDVDDSQFELPPTTLGSVVRDLIDGVYKLKNELLLVINTDEATRVQKT